MAERTARDGYLEAYARFANTLRTWLIAYGVGGPVLIATNQFLSTKLANAGLLGGVAFYFLLGVGLQVVAALILKCAMWYLYLGEEKNELQQSKRYKFACWASEAFWLELLLDGGTITFFGIASFILLTTI